MNSKSTWFWAIVAAALFAFIFLFERNNQPPNAGPPKVLPDLRAAEITGISVRPTGQLEIRAIRANHTWQLTQPMVYPAEAGSIDGLLQALEQLTAPTYITSAELKNHPKADEEYGFDPPQVSLILHRSDYQKQILIGARTAPGDQVFLRVIGVEGVFVVDADLLSLIPRSVNSWRDTSLADLNGQAFDLISVTNGARAFELQRDPTNKLWRLTRPMQVRADNLKIVSLLQKLRGLRVRQFVTDDPKADLESFGLQPPNLELVLSENTNVTLWLQFGSSLTNDTNQVYARRQGQSTIVAVANNLLDPWRAAYDTFRDRHLIAITQPLDAIEVQAADHFTLQKQTNNAWHVIPQNFMADSNLVADFISTLNSLQVTQFVKDVVTEPDLPAYGLGSPAEQYILKIKSSNPTNSTTETTLAQLDFGTVQADKVYVRRTDETSVYAVSLSDFQRLPTNSWQLRDLHIWNFNTNDIANITIEQDGKTRRVLRKGAYSWALAPGSQGIINDLAIEEIGRQFSQLRAAAWTDHGDQSLSRYGFTDKGLKVAFELKSGNKYSVEFGGEAPSHFPYAAVKLNGETCIFEFPWGLYQYVTTYLTIPADAH